MVGYVKLYRKILENPIFKNPELLQLFIYCMLRANHKTGKAFYGSTEIEVGKGQFVTGRFELAKDLHGNESSTYKRLKRLQTLHVLSLKSNNRNTLVTVVNWDLYQGHEVDLDNEVSADGQESNSKVTAKEQQSNSKVTLTRSKECNKDKNERSKDNTAIEIAIDDFQEFRKKIKKPMTDYAVKLLKEKLNKLSTDDETKIAILNQSILSGWQSVFPLKEESRNKPSGNPFKDLMREEGLI